MKKNEILVKNKEKLFNIISKFGLKSSEIKDLFKKKDILIDGIRINKDCFVYEGQNVVFFTNNDLAVNTKMCIENENLEKKYQIVFEDENIIILNKDIGIEVTGNKGLEHIINGAIAVHRLDKNTRGLLIMAKNLESRDILLDCFKNKTITKKYLCEVLNDTDFKGESYKAFLFKDAKISKVYISKTKVNGSVEIETKFKTLKHGKDTSIVECTLITGKTHQIRAHLAFLGHAILGDDKYGDKKLNIKFSQNYQKLFCYYLRFNKIDGKLSYLNNREFLLKPEWYNY